MEDFLKKFKNVVDFNLVLGKDGGKEEQKEERVKLAYYVGCILIILSCFMTLLTVKSGILQKKFGLLNMDGEMSDGIILIVYSLVMLILFYLKKVKPLTTLILSIIPLIYSFILDSRINDFIKEYGSYVNIKNGAASLFLKLGSILVLVCAVMNYLDRNKKTN